MIHLKELRYSNKRGFDGYPFDLPLFREFDGLRFNSNVTILVGENGTGKSTLLEALACAVDAITVGDSSISDDEELRSARQLSHCMKLSWAKKTNKGFFMRAEDFIGYTKRLAAIKRELKLELENIDIDYRQNSEYARALAKIPFKRSLYELEQQYSGDLGEKSHGESFLELFKARFAPNSLYILDEPETPLSPMNQFTFLVMLHEMSKQAAQFIIATHSPIIMAYPGAEIYDFNNLPLRQANYDELEAVNFTKAFLSNRQEFLNRYLFC